MDKIDNRRKEIFNFYVRALAPLAESGFLKLPFIAPGCEPNGHMFYILLRDEETRNDLMNYLKSKGILAIFHYLPLHLSPVGISMGYRQGQFPVTESVSGRLLRLPCYYELKKEQQTEVVEFIARFFEKHYSPKKPS